MHEQDYFTWQHTYWAENASAWEEWADIVAPQAEGFNRALIDAAGVASGGRVLDLACGAGEPALTAAAAAGTEGHVTATDYSEEMLAVCRRRAEAKGFTNMSFQQADMQALPFEDAAFDHVISRFGFMYTEAPEKTAAEIRRVLRPGGKTAMMVWGPMENNTVLSIALNTANAALQVLDEQASEHPAIFATEGSMTGIFTSAGFVNADEIDLKFIPAIGADIPFWRPLVGMNFGAALQDMSQDAVKALDAAVKQAYQPFLTDGKYHLTAHVRILKAEKP